MKINNLDYRIDWRKFKRGTSFFVPCLKIDEGKEAILVVTKRFGFRVAIKPVIEDGFKGLRVWRIK
jgi:hypothetical protein